MQIYLDFSFLNNLATFNNPIQVMWALFIHGGWLIFVFVFLQFLWTLWVDKRGDRWSATINWVLLAIDVPKDNEQSPKAVEHMITNLAGAHSEPNKWDKWWNGMSQITFSLEIVSIDGYIQFLIRTADNWRDMIEAAVYAQYPEAEITEVEDYVGFAPDKYPNDEYELWGSELELVKPEGYPLRTYIEFEHMLTQDLKDPMAALLEMFSRLGKGEQAWFQIVVKPTDDSWKDDAQKIVDGLMGKKLKVPKVGLIGGAIQGIGGEAMQWASEASHSLFSTEPFGEASKAEEDAKMSFLSPGQRRIVELVEYKMAKLGFYCKIRVAYVAKKTVYSKPKRVGTFFAVLKQYGSLNANALKPAKPMTTKADYFFVKTRIKNKQHKFIKAYKDRSMGRGMKPYILNIEELATLYHFPAFTVKAPLLKRTESKKGEPPTSLPLEMLESDEQVVIKEVVKNNEPVVAEETTELEVKDVQYLPDSLKGYNFANDYFEKKFAKKTSAKKYNKTSINKSEQESIESVEAQETGLKNGPPSNLPFIE